MGREPDQTPAPDETVVQDMSSEERDALLRDTIKNLLEAFSEPAEGDDVDTITKLHDSAAEAVTQPTEEPS